MFPTNWLTVDFYSVEFDDEWRVGIFDGEKLVPTGADGDRKFLVELSPGSGLRCFASLKLAARELPKIPVALMGWALANQKPAVAFNHGRHYTNCVAFAHWQSKKLSLVRNCSVYSKLPSGYQIALGPPE